MTDFYSVLQRAVATLPDGGGPQRRQVYEKARKALLKQLQSFDPPLPSADVTAQRLALEDAIRKIENEIARQNRARRAVAGATAATPGTASAVVAATPAAPAAPTVIAPQPPRETEAEREARRRAAAAQAERERAERMAMLNDAVSDAAFAAGNPAPPPPVVAALPAPASLPPEPVDVVHTPAFDPDDHEPVTLPERRRGGRVDPGFGSGPDAHDAEFEEVVEDDADAEPAEAEPEEDERAARRRRRQEERAAKADRRSDRKAAAAAAPRREPARREGGTKRKSGRSVVARVALPVIALALLAGGSYAAFTQRERLMEVIESVGSVAEPRAPVAVAATPGVTKNEDRLAVEGEETRTVATQSIRVGAAAGEDEAAAEGTGADPAPIGEDAGPEAQQFAATASGPAAEAAANDAAATAAPAPTSGEIPQSPPVAVTNGGTVEQAVLYEEAATPGAQGGSAVKGSVSWAMESEALGGAPAEPVVRATARIEQRNMTATITIRENADSGLPASHLIEIQFTIPDGFEGGGIKNVPGIIMKETEESRGDALRGAAARVSSGLFWIALSEEEADRVRNIELLQTRDWIDVPILYENGRRAILTVSKGAEGLQSVNAAIRSWTSG